MKKTIRKITAVLLCVMMLVPAVSVSGYADSSASRYTDPVIVHEKCTDCGDDCEFYPTIIIPGLGQSNVMVADENGDYVLDSDGNTISAFPAYIQLPEILKTAVVPAVASLLLQRDAGLSDALAKVIDSCFGINKSDLEAQNTGNVILERYYWSYEDCTEYEKEIINHHIPFKLYPTDLPYDHLYYFTYNSFGNHIDVTKELYDYIQMVKEQTGHDKINLVPISQGGTFANAIFDYYPEVMDSLHKVLYIVPALDGSTIIGDVFTGNIEFLDPEFVYNGFLENLGLLDKDTAKIIEIALRILPDEVLMTSLEKAVGTLVEDVMIRSTSMWALCPSGNYLEAAEKYLSAPEMASIKEQTYKYYQAQLHSDDNIKKLLDKGVQVFNVAEYNFPMIDVGSTWDTQNADFIIHLDSTSMGAYAANVGETLPEDYVQKNTYCSNPEHNHISPDRVVDASAGVLADTTFYFVGQRHDLTQHNDVILEIAMELIAHDDITDVYSDPRFPQFNTDRDTRNLYTLLESAEDFDTASLSAEDAAEFAAAVKQAEDALEDTTVEAGTFEAAEKRLAAILATQGLAEITEEKEPSEFLPKLSLWLYENYGTNGFSEMPLITLKNLWNMITGK